MKNEFIYCIGFAANQAAMVDALMFTLFKHLLGAGGDRALAVWAVLESERAKGRMIKAIAKVSASAKDHPLVDEFIGAANSVFNHRNLLAHSTIAEDGAEGEIYSINLKNLSHAPRITGATIAHHITSITDLAEKCKRAYAPLVPALGIPDQSPP